MTPSIKRHWAAEHIHFNTEQTEQTEHAGTEAQTSPQTHGSCQKTFFACVLQLSTVIRSWLRGATLPPAQTV